MGTRKPTGTTGEESTTVSGNRKPTDMTDEEKTTSEGNQKTYMPKI